MSKVEQRHRPGHLKQQNKPFKSKFATKGELKRKAKGRVERTTRQSIKQTKIMDKEARRRRAKQIQQNKRKLLLEKKRIGTSGAPKIVAIIPLGIQANGSLVKKCLLDSQGLSVQNSFLMTVCLKDFKQRITIIEPKRVLRSILDAGKVADLLLFVINAKEGIDSEGKQHLTLLKAQGIPTCMVAIQGVSQEPNKKKQKKLQKAIEEVVEKEFPEKTKIVNVDATSDGKNLCRWIHESTIRTIHWREMRPYMLIDKWEFSPNQQTTQVTSVNGTQQQNGTLVVYGYLRGKPLSANRLIHIGNFGTYQILKICKECDPYSTHKKASKENVKFESQVVSVPDNNQESLQSEVIPDPMANEQTWPTEEDFKLAKKETKKKIPEGMTSHEAAWIVDSDGEFPEDESEDDEVVSEDDDVMVDENEKTIEEQALEKEIDTKTEIMSQKDKLDIADDEKMDEMEREAEKKYIKEMMEKANDYKRFPDEVEVPDDIPAKIRFQKYRGLKSFRSSPWDPKENLPLDYARIFQFENFNRTQKKGKAELEEDETAVQVDEYISIHIANVPQQFTQKADPNDVLAVYGLLRHENKMTLMHLLVKRRPECNLPIKSKAELIAQIGFRNYKCAPIYSEHNPRFDKHKFERFFNHGEHLVASLYVCATYTPAPVFLWKENNGKLELVATGTVMGANTDRIILKKIVLTGQPFKIHKRQGIVRFMFNSPEDVNWFKPVELWTKLGRHGIIKEPVGTHGYMKCQFDDVVYSHDVVCMSLYKRVYPKWTTSALSLLN